MRLLVVAVLTASVSPAVAEVCPPDTCIALAVHQGGKDAERWETSHPANKLPTPRVREPHTAWLGVVVRPIHTAEPAYRPRAKPYDLRVREVAPVRVLDLALRDGVAPPPSPTAMPWIWQVLRTNVYSRLPRYDRLEAPETERFSLVLSPVVVTSPQDTVPGVGIEGAF